MVMWIGDCKEARRRGRVGYKRRANEEYLKVVRRVRVARRMSLREGHTW